MRPFTVNGDVWRVVRVSPSDPLLVDRTGVVRLATCDPSTNTVYVSVTVRPPLLDRVMLHEVSHAVTVSHGLLGPLRRQVPPNLWVAVEEWAAQLMEAYSLEALEAASESLGRPVCVRGLCYDRLGDDRAGDQRAGDQV